MTDIALFTDEDGLLDILPAGGDLTSDDGLSTALAVSIYSDRRADVGEVREGEDPRGWWGDTAFDRWGSKLWLIRRDGVTNESAEQARLYVLECLRWLLEDEIAAEVLVNAERAQGGRIDIDVTVARGTARRFDAAWRASQKLDVSIPGNRIKLSFT